MKRNATLPSSLRIVPTRADIIAGTCNSPTKCMYAMALRRMFPSATYVSVNTNCITITLNGVYYHYIIPRKAVKNIVLYDDSKPIDTSKAQITLDLATSRPANYVSTKETREYHRIKSAKRRASPDYVRPDSRETIRGQLARARQAVRKAIEVAHEH